LRSNANRETTASRCRFHKFYCTTYRAVLRSLGLGHREHISDAAANEAFNISNGDLARWEHLWPQLVAFFEMEAAPPLHMPLVTFMADKAPLWDHIVRKYDLKPYTFAEIAAWPFLDGMLGMEYDVISDTGKARRAGFHDAVDTEAMFVRTFTQFRADRIIP
jgi:hypothetical protein